MHADPVVVSNSGSNNPIQRPRRVVLVGALLAATLLKLGLFLNEAVPFNGDEAVVGLMARHILSGARPVFFYGQAYMGSLDAWLVAGAFALLGESVLAIRLVQGLLFLAYLVSLFLLVDALFRDPWVAELAVVLVAIPTVLVTTYTTPSLGGYGEVLVLGNLVLYLGYQVSFGPWGDRRLAWLALGLVGGAAFWVLGMAGIYLLPVAILGIWAGLRRARWSCYLLALAGFLVGSSPWWMYNLGHAWAAWSALSAPGANPTTPLEHLLGLLLLGLPALAGLRFPWEAELASTLILLPGALLYLAALAFGLASLRRNRLGTQPGARRLLGLFCLVFLGVFLFTRFGIDASGRYLLPLNLLVVIGIAVFLARLWRWRPAAGALLLLAFLSLNMVQTLQAAFSSDRITTQFGPVTRFDNSYDDTLIQFLREHGELRGYSNYWVAYRLAFLTQEELIYAPRLPYRETLVADPGDNRYPPYDQIVADSERVAYITTKNPRLDALISLRFNELGVDYRIANLGHYHVVYALSRPVRPDELGLGKSLVWTRFDAAITP